MSDSGDPWGSAQRQFQRISLGHSEHSNKTCILTKYISHVVDRPGQASSMRIVKTQGRLRFNFRFFQIWPNTVFKCLMHVFFFRTVCFQIATDECSIHFLNLQYIQGVLTVLGLWVWVFFSLFWVLGSGFMSICSFRCVNEYHARVFGVVMRRRSVSKTFWFLSINSYHRAISKSAFVL